MPLCSDSAPGNYAREQVYDSTMIARLLEWANGGIIAAEWSLGICVFCMSLQYAGTPSAGAVLLFKSNDEMRNEDLLRGDEIRVCA